MAINRIPLNSLEISNLFLGSFDSKRLPLDDINLRVLQTWDVFWATDQSFLIVCNCSLC